MGQTRTLIIIKSNHKASKRLLSIIHKGLKNSTVNKIVEAENG